MLACATVPSRLPFALVARAILFVLCGSATLSPLGVAAQAARARCETPGRGRNRPIKPPRREETAASRRAARLGLGTRSAAGQLLAGRAEPAWFRAAGDGNRAPGTLGLPVANGWFVRGFGSGRGAYHQAIDIGGEMGWNVRAAAPGIVGYAGDELNGYGNLIILIHPGRLITLYAHNARNRVTAGQRVDRGAVIASLGSTGLSMGPHVHFELLYDGKNCDPAPLLHPILRHRHGKPIAVPGTRWRTLNKRPSAVTCDARRHHPDHRGTGSDKVEADVEIENEIDVEMEREGEVEVAPPAPDAV